ncbi:transcription repressor OFP14-like [Phalaenopsis equestris]|uniref:transcription repressor OFP14-like n=1 Tax=Phalaenopsis equestris TaxID=78828 RepID=UPI0009E57172|nr:transcription repressor OFP14-like [Phalaenopsis equestris]
MATGKKKGFHKSIKIYFSMLKKMPTSLTQLSSTPSSSSSLLFSACKYPKTPSFALNRNSATTTSAAAAAATLSDVDRFLHENFQSLYPPPPATSNSSQEPTSPTSSSGEAAEFSGGGVAVMTFSKDPYEDFRRSMEDMMEVRHVDKLGPLDWDFMEELLLCYLELNEQGVHKYILRAFTDLTVSFRRREGEERRKASMRRRRLGRTEKIPVAGGRFPAGW